MIGSLLSEGGRGWGGRGWKGWREYKVGKWVAVGVACGCCGRSLQFILGQGQGDGKGFIVMLRSLVFVLLVVIVIGGFLGGWQRVIVTYVILEFMIIEFFCYFLFFLENFVYGVCVFQFKQLGCKFQDCQACLFEEVVEREFRFGRSGRQFWICYWLVFYLVLGVQTEFYFFIF